MDSTDFGGCWEGAPCGRQVLSVSSTAEEVEGDRRRGLAAGEGLRRVDELLRLEGHRGVDHLAVEGAGAAALRLGLLEGADDAPRLLQFLLGGAEDLVQRTDLVGMDGELTFEAEAQRLLGVGLDPRGVLVGDEGGVDGELVGGAGGDGDVAARVENLLAVLATGESPCRRRSPRRRRRWRRRGRRRWRSRKRG